MLYLDASALVKRYVAEEGSEALVGAMGEAHGWALCRVGYVETARAIGQAAGKGAVKRFMADWPSFEVVEVDASLAEQAAELIFTEELRSLDALHLAAALLLVSQELTLATWDARLHRAAQRQGLAMFPQTFAERIALSAVGRSASLRGGYCAGGIGASIGPLLPYAPPIITPAGHSSYRAATVAPGSRESEADSGEIAGNPCASARFQAPVPEIGADSGTASSALQKPKRPRGNHFQRWS